MIITLKRRESAAALVIVLAFIVILSGLVVAYLTRTTTDRQLANESFNSAKADGLARSALPLIVGDLKQEIAAGSTTSLNNGVTIYMPSAPANIEPQRSGVPTALPAPIPNLIRRSVASDPIVPPGVGSRASNVSSLTPSQDGRSITPARWNKHYLIPRVTGASATDTTPVSDFTPPDWVFLTSTGPQVISAPSRSVIGRYAFAIYDEGGLIDANVAGFPPAPNTTVAQSGPKGILAFADLTVLGMSTSAVNDLVGFRNYATAQPSGDFGSFDFTTTSATTYYNAVLALTNGFLEASPTLYSGRTDQQFVNRQALLSYRTPSSINFTANALQYLGTFSRGRNVSVWNSSQFARFPLSKLAELSGTDAALIRTDFGLVTSGGQGQWKYEGPTGTTELSVIGPYNSAAPEFFQLLNSALGGRPIAEILTIGASIADQADADSVSTGIEYANPDPAATPSKVYGVDVTAAPTPAPTPPSTPVVLNRPLRDAGELGYAYKDVATGKTLDFTTNGSTDAAVLDLFSYSSAPLSAGKVNLNTRNELVLEAILGGAIQTQPISTISTTNRETVAKAIVSATSAVPAANLQDLARLTGTAGSSLGTEEGKEAISRALSESCQTRTWNLMIDVIAQSGTYPPVATNLANFIVTGERRYWLHVAIDRYTGEIIDQQLEAVIE